MKSTTDAEKIAATCRALAHPARVRIVQLLAEQVECRGAEVFAELPLAQSTISEHLRVLKDAGIVHATPLGTSMVYCIVPGAIDPLLEVLTELASAGAACGTETGVCG